MEELTPNTSSIEDPIAPTASEAGIEGVGGSSIRQKLDAARRELLDLTLRNRLINTPRRKTRSSSIEVIDEKSAEVFRILVGDGKAMSFDPRAENEIEEKSATASACAQPGCDDWSDRSPAGDAHALESDESDGALVQPEDEALDEHGIAARHKDARLQSAMQSEKLQTRLLRMYYDARTAIEEQGVNILFLALGFVKWYESDSSDVERFAPLVLVPVELNRSSARSRFTIRFADDDITTNLSLKEKLKVDFGVDLPELPDAEDIDLPAYFEQVRAAIAAMPRWEVLDDDMVLGFFSFAKLLMYRDLDADNWPAEKKNIIEQPLVKAVLADGFAYESPLVAEDASIDELLSPSSTMHVVDADSSQSLAIEEVRRGRNLVIQGPPGTGKSQTIANIIAAAIAEGKRVLFLAEKLAALDVVKRRLTKIGLGDMCLELHSNKARKKEVLKEIERTLDLGPPRVGDVEQTASQLQVNRDRLNAHCALMHKKFEPSSATPYEIIGAFVRLQQRGVAPADFRLDESANWTPSDVRTRRESLQALAQQAEAIGIPAHHPWRGVMLESSIPGDRDRFVSDLPAALALVTTLIEQIDGLQKLLFASTQHRLKDAARLHAFAEAMIEAPKLDATAIANDVWAKQREDLARLVENGTIYASRRVDLNGIVVDAAWSFDAAEARRNMAAWGRSMLRFLNGPYRRAKAALRGILTGKLPKSLDERLKIFDKLIEARAAKSVLESRDELGRSAFGTFWRGEDSDFGALAAIDAWEAKCNADAAVPDSFRGVLRKIADRGALEQAARDIAVALTNCRDALELIIGKLKLDVDAAFASASTQSESRQYTIDDVPLESWAQRIDEWRANPEEITKWIAYGARDVELREQGCGALCDRLNDGRVSADAAGDTFEMLRCEAVIRAMMKEPALQSFNGLSHEQVLERFRRLDVERIELARRQIAQAHYDGIPRGGAGIGELGIIRNEIARKRGHMPIRKLLARAGNAMVRIKPVMMMSPMSIAQYVEPGALEFDILVIDEASQVRPVDALGAAARATQFVVVGDDKQLPPTRFFNRMLDDAVEVDDDSDDMAVGDLESVLGMCRSRGMADRMLRWHYRSRHHSLIAVSNREFYEQKLYIIPSPARRDAEHGVVFHHITNGIYDRSNTRCNREEARAVAEAAMRHATETPNLTLGVGAFSVAQRDAIIDELELLRRERPDCEQFFASGAIEPFFVKNLENIQGDERDVIYISVGYGRDSSGSMSMNFGPLSNDGGERRLNVLITRAKQRCEIFSSITDDDIDLNRATGFGPRALKTYLAYARTGQLGVSMASGRDHDSDFEAAVASALRSAGYQVDAQVDEVGFFIDLAVADPDQPGRYILGIECDGASYHSARSARDRDRTRQAVLEDRGWRIHRIWSTDWFNRPQDELRKVIDQAELSREALRSIAANGGAAEAPAQRAELDIIDRDEMSEEDADLSQPYVEASFKVPASTAIPDMAPSQLAKIVVKIVDIEGPIHPDEIAQRVTDLFQVQRTGARIARAVSSAIIAAAQAGGLRMEDDGFVTHSNETERIVRNRADVASSTLRKVEMLPPSEIRLCLQLLLERHLGATRDELIRSTARQFGFRSTSAALREFFSLHIDGMKRLGLISEDDGRLRFVDAEHS